MSVKLQYCFDLTSPYSYMGFEILQRYNNPKLWSKHVTIEYVPMYLGGVMQLSQNKPPGTNVLKTAWMGTDLTYSSKFYDIPIKLVPTVGFPLNTLNPLRCLTLIKSNESPEKFQECIHQLFTSYWVKDLNISDLDVLRKVLESVALKKTPDFYIESLDTAKETLKKVTEDLVLSKKCFGAPWIVLTKSEGGESECFFGSDRFDLIAKVISNPNVKYYGGNPEDVPNKL